MTKGEPPLLLGEGLYPKRRRISGLGFRVKEGQRQRDGGTEGKGGRGVVGEERREGGTEGEEGKGKWREEGGVRRGGGA